MCGYYGKHGYVAQFEDDLDNRCIYEISRRLTKANWQGLGKGRKRSSLKREILPKPIRRFQEQQKKQIRTLLMPIA
jgi:hypothetical protein